MACDCFEKVSAACKEKICQRVGDDLAEIVDSGFEHTLWHFKGGDHSPVALNYRFRYYRMRKNGQPESRQTNADTVVAMRYCPFCGTEFKGDGLNKAGDELLDALRSFITDDDIKALDRFAECCDDPDAGGHDLHPEQVQSLVNIGILRKSGRNHHETTHFGDFVLSTGEGHDDA